MTKKRSSTAKAKEMREMEGKPEKGGEASTGAEEKALEKASMFNKKANQIMKGRP